ncbi:hypothetical protein DTO013E5_8896 [Penicillium roqueforti]|uniref:Genomic scaffold, ProqFM164S02 n=1 Tax=Penicillium roqueforti (strain FM164) TaxID=1365484 RepID=W6QE70_PENRF|nr:uncharacterized protein LCP9604111_8499 [Penicillium roqueforti]CDM32499.1 unnamed protein product [Penicillium roqueforti FM164]KAF9241264.1 hypothetical protein LCP9604111_8499 [Penicillium roqueforti]KAI1830302.1 hypothetical protein CBS147337_8933 [Penicillium roqueforti]KAI2672310.1 hypothetical protein LCP963914a_9435 [Penicillium roqueforti]KAI2672441.1 hypothetical protein CBS147355_8161 [Penicillium roqueforti]
MNSSNQSSPQQPSTPNTGSSTAAAGSSSTPPTSSTYTYTEKPLSDAENFQRNTDHMGGWIKDLDHPDQLTLSN